MIQYIKASVLFFALSIFLFSCVNVKQPRSKVDFFTLEYEPLRIDGLSSLPDVIRLVRFNVAPAYDSNRIIYRDQSYKRNSYFYYKWQSNPGDLITHLLCRDMRYSGLFLAVLPSDSKLYPTHLLEGMVDEFFELDMDDSWNAVLSVTITLTAQNELDKGKGILFQKSYNIKKPTGQRRPEALAEAMSQAMSALSRDIIKDVYSTLKDHSKDDGEINIGKQSRR